MKRNNVLVLLGPTATGKTSLATFLAKELNGEIISADSMQVYRGMDIGTAKPSKEQLEGAPHHLINIKDPDEAWTVSDFIRRATSLVGEIQKKHKLPIIVGGTGLYLNSFLEGFSLPMTAPNPELRSDLEKEDPKDLWKKLAKIDPEAAKKISENDKKRIIRALEVYEETGKPISMLQKRSPISDRYNVIMVGLNIERAKLYERINQRVDSMVRTGLIDEVRKLLSGGFHKKLNSMQALGYKEMIGHLEGKAPLKETVELIKQKTRNFARRQMTWFRRFSGAEWFEGGENLSPEKILLFVKKQMK